jgi:hypothetical protein
MKKQFIKFSLVTTLLLVLAQLSVAEDDYPLNQIHLVADALNPEGGTIAQKYLQPHQVWANLCVVLDRPFQDGIEWDELTRNNQFPLKEASLLNYNEAQVNLAYAAILNYYITKAHKIAKKNVDDEVKLLIQVHRNTSGPKHLKLLESLLTYCYPELVGEKYTADQTCKQELFGYHFTENKVLAQFCFGTFPEYLGDMGKYKDADIVLSFSLVAGFHPNFPSGSLLIPTEWVPFSLGKMELYENQKYTVRNHIVEVIQEIIASQNDALIQSINRKFLSLNALKQDQKAKRLTLDDFKRARLVQVDGMFNPSKHGAKFTKVNK